MSDIRWDILGPPVDIGAAFRNGMETGRATMRRNQRDQAISALAHDPSNPQAVSALAAIDPESAWKFEAHAREQRIREGIGQVLGGPTQPSALAPAAPLPPAPAMDGLGAPAPVASPTAPTAPASAPAGYNQDALRRLFAEDPGTAKQVMEFIQSATKEEREAVAARYAAAVPLLTEAARMPYEQRRAFIMQQAPALIAQGWTQEQLAGFDPTDTNIRGQIAIGTPLKDYQHPPAMQQNYEFLNGIDPKLGTDYLHRQTDEPPLIAPNGDGTFTIIPRTSGSGARQPPAARPDEATLRQQAADAIAKGADPAAVNARLEQMLRGGAGPEGPQTFP